MDNNEQIKPESEVSTQETTQVVYQEVTPTGFFAGFQVAYPEYEILTPQTLQSFTIRSLTVADEENLKGSLVTPRKLPEHINSIIFNSLVKKPDHIRTLKDFLDSTTVKDRDALLYGLYHISYKDLHDFDIKCMHCQASYPVKISLNKIFQMDAYIGEPNEILNKRIPVKLEVVKGVTAFIKQPTLTDELDLINNMLFQNDKNLELGTEMLVVDFFEADVPNSDLKNKISGIDNLFRAYQTMPSADRKLINKAYIDNFGKYTINMKAESTCDSCGKSNETAVDLIQQFFRTMFQ